MDIERLKELKSVVFRQFQEWITSERKGVKMSMPTNEMNKDGDDLTAVLDEAIARQSVKSEEVAEAIGDLLDMKEHWCADSTDNDAISIDLAITALQDYQPWIPVSNVKPESGKHVLLCCEVRPSGKRYVCDGYYAGSKSITSGYSDDWDCEYDEETDEHYLPEGYYEVFNNWDDYSSIVIDYFVTHWKPLPEPPKGE